jgi:hypothetical protein
MFYYEQSDGNGDWSDFMTLLQFLNSSSSETFAAEVESRIDTSSMLRAMAVESFMLATDNYANGGNFYAYHRTSDKHTDQWVMFETDFDEVFRFASPTSTDPADSDIKADIFDFFLVPQHADRYEDINPLLQRLLSESSSGLPYRDQYVTFYSAFIEALFGSKSLQQPAERYSAMLQLVLPWVARDRLWQMSFGMTTEDFLLDAENTIAHLPMRYMNTSAQIANYWNTKMN